MKKILLIISICLLFTGCSLLPRKTTIIGNRINDTYVLGTPYFTVIGDRYDGTTLELEETKSGNKESINIDEINNYFEKKGAVESN